MTCFVEEAFQLLCLAFGNGDTGLVVCREKEQVRMGESQKSIDFVALLLSFSSK